MWSHRARIVVMVAVGTLVSAPATQAQEKPQASPHIQTALTFLTAWGNQRWDELKTVAAVQVTVKVGDKALDRKSTRLNSSHGYISYAVFCLKKKKTKKKTHTHSNSNRTY